MHKALRRNHKITSVTQAKRIDNGCTRKKIYSNKNTAKSRAVSVSKRIQEKVEAYKCSYGNHYHIGHAKKEEDICIDAILEASLGQT